jgi:hypothetical protein
MSVCIPIQYAANRASATVKVAQIAGLVGISGGGDMNSLAVNAIKDCLVAAGWTLDPTAGPRAAGGLFLTIPLPVIGFGGTEFVCNWLGTTYYVFDPANPPHVFPVGIPVAAGGTAADTAKSVAAAMSSTTWKWSYVNDTNLSVTSTAQGTNYNGFSGSGRFGAGVSTTNGGWNLISQAANGISQIQVSVYGGGQSSGANVDITLNGHLIQNDLASLVFGERDYFLMANEYQFFFFGGTNNDSSPSLFACAPYVNPTYAAGLGYTAFVGPQSETFRQSTIAYTDGHFWVGGGLAAIVEGLLWSFQSSNPLLVSSGKTLAYQHYLTMPLHDGTFAVIGSIWDAWIESAQRTFTEEVQYDGRNWRPIFSQSPGGPLGPDAHDSVGTVWLAVN